MGANQGGQREKSQSDYATIVVMVTISQKPQMSIKVPGWNRILIIYLCIPVKINSGPPGDDGTTTARSRKEGTRAPSFITKINRNYKVV